MSSKRASVHDWASIEVDRPMEKIDRQRVIGEKMMLSRLILHEGFSVDLHHHENEQHVLVLRGRCRFRLGEVGGDGVEEVVLGAGQVLVVPSNVPHACEALEESELIDVFSPVSEKTGVDRS